MSDNTGASRLRVTVYGAGAVGGHLAARLCALPRLSVAIVARGAHLDAVRRDGLRLISGAQEWHCRPEATDDPAQLPPQDIVFVTLKAPAIATAAPAIGRLLAPTGVAVFLTNGLPWWMDSAGDEILSAIGAERFLGGIVYSANYLERPGVVRHESYDLWQVGEPAGGLSQRAESVAALLREAGLTGSAHAELRRAIWTKLILNASANPLAALTRLNGGQMAARTDLASLLLTVRREIGAIAAAQGFDLRDLPTLQSVDDMIGATGAPPSMLQDALAGRPLEVDAVVDAPRRVAAAGGVATPALDVLSVVLGGLDQSLAIAGGRAR